MISPAAKLQFAAVSVAASVSAPAAIENTPAFTAPLTRVKLSDDPVAAVETTAIALVMVPANGRATLPTRDVVNTPGMLIVTVVGASTAVDIVSSFWF